MICYYLSLMIFCYLVPKVSPDNVLHFEPRMQPTDAKISTLAAERLSNFQTTTEAIEHVTQDPVISSCKAFIDVFSSAAANYTQCALANSRPLRLCTNCVVEYVTAIHLYNVIMKGEAMNDKNQLCRDIILNSDRIRIVVRLGQFVESLWDDCFCGTCFSDYQYNNSDVTYHMSSEAEKFLELYDDSQKCFNNHTFDEIGTNISSCCEDCASPYGKLNNFYWKWEDRVNRKLCMDLVDMMNATRLEWSGSFGCHKQPGSPLVLIAVTTLIGLMPVVFYISMRVCCDRRYSHILAQHRLRISRRITVTTPPILDSSYPGYSPRQTPTLNVQNAAVS